MSSERAQETGNVMLASQQMGTFFEGGGGGINIYNTIANLNFLNNLFPK